ncbi:MAG: prepilin-type N-terminal cleavage/methylation domain-containing protein [Acidobacteriota bacterium]
MKATESKQRGFTLIELLIVLAIIGILAAIALANFANAMNRSRQKKSMADMRSMAIAWEARATDVGRYNAAGFTFPGNTVTFAQLQSVITPTYLKKIPQSDGWGDAFDLGLDFYGFGAASNAQVYAIRSRGRDNTVDAVYVAGTTTRFDCDIIFSNGSFAIYPEGVHLDK